MVETNIPSKCVCISSYQQVKELGLFLVPPHQEGTAEVVWASVQAPSQNPSWYGAMVKASRDEVLVKTKDKEELKVQKMTSSEDGDHVFFP